MKIDTRTITGMVAVMLNPDGLRVESRNRSKVNWNFGSFDPTWNWEECDYRLVPQTLEEAFMTHMAKISGLGYGVTSASKSSFEAGAKWQKEQDNE